MYVCNCNPFTDGQLKEHLRNRDDIPKLKDAYRACSGADKPNCGSCLKETKRIIDEFAQSAEGKKKLSTINTEQDRSAPTHELPPQTEKPPQGVSSNQQDNSDKPDQSGTQKKPISGVQHWRP